MASEAKGRIIVPCWVDDGVVKPLVNDDGEFIVTAELDGQEIESHLYGWTGAAWERVNTDSGALQVYFMSQETDVEVKQQAPGDMMVGIHGYIGGAWQRQPLQWGYSDVYGEAVYRADVGIGDEIVTLSVVPTGELWVINNIMVYGSVATFTRIEIVVYVDNIGINVKREVYPTAQLGLTWTGSLVMKEDDRVEVVFRGCGATDDVWVQAAGYKMSINL